MTVVLVLVFLVLIGAGVAVLVRGRSTAAVTAGDAPGRAIGTAEPAAARRSSVRGLRIGDVVAHDGHDAIVERSYRFREGGSRWEEHLLVDGDYTRWLSVEDDEGLECVLWERRPDPTLEPGERTLEVDGVAYRFDERGTADYTLEEQDGPGGSGRAEYADYVAGEQRLSFERYDGSASWEINVGAVVSEHAFDVYPGSGS
ncbi:DUF4178 domain-containing protein [Conexibacter sp. W3-3-2]|uniref:DUF4178 domain-containing protein n=1 Tax=Conexibacter sp. W3-3-2 TaxID=2675227 RepID=UPI0012B76D8E|nr:DUF4178 domain-containing protein [Conexibacter sp. W3-3-2]MTD44344.1 DUF4178 domain-containing protein [Conexibacter sp. W3-3-2]